MTVNIEDIKNYLTTLGFEEDSYADPEDAGNIGIRIWAGEDEYLTMVITTTRVWNFEVQGSFRAPGDWDAMAVQDHVNDAIHEADGMDIDDFDVSHLSVEEE